MHKLRLETPHSTLRRVSPSLMSDTAFKIMDESAPTVGLSGSTHKFLLHGDFKSPVFLFIFFILLEATGVVP